MIDTPRIIRSTAKFAAVIPLDIPRSDMMEAFGPAVSELLAALSAQGLKPNGSAFAHHLRMTPERFNFEVGFQVSTPVRPQGARQARHAAGCHGGTHGVPRRL